MSSGQEVRPEAAPSQSPESTRRPRTAERLAPAVAVAAVVSVALGRVLANGFDLVAADDAAYVRIGRELWRFHEPRFVDGSIYTIRSWVFPLLSGGASLVGGTDPFTGPRILGWVFATTALALATVIAARTGRGWAAVGTAVVLLATPVVWSIVPTTRIDTALVFFVVVLLLVIDTPTPRRAVVAGVVAGLALLVKETSAPLVFLPLAYVGVMSRPAWWRFVARYVGAFVVTVSWWFVVVLVVDGEVFPLQGLRQAAARSVPRSWTAGASAWVLVALWVAGWALLLLRRHREPRARLLVLAGLAFVPATVIAWVDELALRQFVPIAVLSCIAVGVAAADSIAAITRRGAGSRRRAVAVALTAGAVAAMALPVVLTQRRLELEAQEPKIDTSLAQWLGARPGTPDVATTFKYRTALWVRLDGEAVLHDLAYERSESAPELRSAVAVDIRRDGYQTVTRRHLREVLDGADYLLLTGPGRRSPIGLATWLRQHGRSVGLPLAAEFGTGRRGPWAFVFRVDRPRLGAIPTVVSGFAAEAMLADGGFRPTSNTTVAGTLGSIARVQQQVPAGSFAAIHARAF
jgi:hypothetical protein